MLDPGICSGHLRDCLFLGERGALVGWRFACEAAMVFEAVMFLLSVGLQHHFHEKDERFGMPYVLR